MIFVDDTGFYPLYVGDVIAKIPGWTPNDPLPSGWFQVVETAPPDDNGHRTETEILNPEPVDGFIPPNCEGIRQVTSIVEYDSIAVYDADSESWIQEWVKDVVDLTDPNLIDVPPIVAVKREGVWLSPSEYMAAYPNNND